MFDLQPHEEKIDTSHDDIFQVILGFGVFKLNMQAVFDTDIHLDWVVRFRGHAIRVDPEILLANHICHPPRDRHPHKVPQLHIDTIV